MPRCIDGFLCNKEYATMPETKFTTNLQQFLCLECSIWHTFLRKSFTNSITARFLRSILRTIFVPDIILHNNNRKNILHIKSSIFSHLFQSFRRIRKIP